MEDKQHSPGVLKGMVWPSGAMASFGEAEQVFHRMGHMSISDNSIWRWKERWGERFKALEEAGREKANRLGRGTSLGEPMVEPEKRVGVSMDGTMVHVVEEGWKELKVGCAFDVDVRAGWNEGNKEWEEWAHAANNHYVAHLGGPEMLGQLLWAEAQRQGWERAREREVVGDGAAWVWKVSDDHFFEGRELVDWYHAMEHLSGVASLLHGEGTGQSKRWYRSAQTALYQGHAGRIARELKEAASGYPEGVGEEIRGEAGYLDKHERPMQYVEIREEGYVIGSGMVESGGKQFKSRFCGQGMRWSRAGIERLIPIRAAIMSDRFDTTWKAAYNSPPS